MAGYFARPKPTRADDDGWWDRGPLVPHLSVSDHEATDTGLLDHRGDTIWRAPNPMGFGRAQDWADSI
jgi:hypothetical protein